MNRFPSFSEGVDKYFYMKKENLKMILLELINKKIDEHESIFETWRSNDFIPKLKIFLENLLKLSWVG